MKRILFVMLAMLVLTISAVPVMADQSQIQTRTGVVIVVDGRYFLDTDVPPDGEADIYLDFGPPWYDPGIPRPSDGVTVTVTGKLTGEGTPDAEMDVYSIDGSWWRNPGRPPWVHPHPQGK